VTCLPYTSRQKYKTKHCYSLSASTVRILKMASLEEITAAETNSKTYTLKDGRKLGYTQCGLLTGKTVFYFHGLPGSRVEAAAFDAFGKELGARVIAVDRPGYGWSSPHAKRTILSTVKDVEHLAEGLNVDSYGVLGISGGGPYALAAAASMPRDKLKGVAVAVGLGLPDMRSNGQNLMHYLGFKFGWPYMPNLVHYWFKQEAAMQLQLSDDQRYELQMKQFWKSKPHPKDAEVLGDGREFRLMLRQARQAYAQPWADGVGQDGHLLSRDFGFRVQDIRKDLPVRLWYGKQDTHCPPSHGEQIKERLGGNANAMLRVEDETHASLTMNWRRRILEDLLKSM
jgi:pimeloyl-ACP methyl ester carboxylesterase